MGRLGLTQHGYAALIAAAVAGALGRVFGLVELYIIAAACVGSVLVALSFVVIRHPRVESTRHVPSTLLIAGESGQVEFDVRHQGRFVTTRFTLHEPLHQRSTTNSVARMPVGALGPRTTTSVAYRIPSEQRGVLDIGPLQMIVEDPLGLARSTSTLVDADEILIAPRALTLDMPRLGRGALGRALLDSARRLGPGDFHGLRPYAQGDEPRSIHWRASARTDELMVREHTVRDLHHCTVVFDPSPGSHANASGFEHGVSAAASLVHSAMLARLTTRFVTADGVDLRGPQVATSTLRVLARVQPSEWTAPMFGIELTDGLTLIVVVAESRDSPAWRVARAIANPAITRVLVATNEVVTSPLMVAARSEREFADNWRTLTGHHPPVDDPDRPLQVPLP